MRGILLVVLYISLAFGLPSRFDKNAPTCEAANCTIENNCRCSSVESPLTEGEAPQLIVLSFDESVVSTLYDDYWNPLLTGRTNPDGNPISATFYVPHEYTDYKSVQDLWKSGYEIGVNSITKSSLQSYWRTASLQTLKDEFGGQRTIISTFANLPKEDVTGARMPMLQINGDVSIQAYVESGITYDNSWATFNTELLFPYTLDYKSIQSCTSGNECPVESHEGFWIAPITDLIGYQEVECNALVTCNENGTADEISTWLLGQIDKVKSGKKAPITLLVSSAWFQVSEHSYEGLVKTLDTLATYEDVFLVSQSQVLDWVRNPVPLADFKTDVPTNRTGTCRDITCILKNEDGLDRYMTSCVPCPEVYPWLGNPLGQANPTTPGSTTEGTTADGTTTEGTTADGTTTEGTTADGTTTDAATTEGTTPEETTAATTDGTTSSITS